MIISVVKKSFPTLGKVMTSSIKNIYLELQQREHTCIFINKGYLDITKINI